MNPKLIKSLAMAALLLTAAPLSAQTNQTNQANQTNQTNNVLDVKNSLTDSNIVYPESFESDTQKMLEGWYMKNYTAFDDRYKNVADTKYDDATIRQRLAKLPTLIELPYNQVVRSYIDRYTQKGRAQVTALLGLSLYYNPIFEQALEEQGLPLELKYLPVIESALNPNAVSKHGATGLWQFMIQTAKGLGMEVNTLVDERRDPYLSSRLAAKYLSDLYKLYGDWSLAIAAYNCGPGAVNKAIRRAGGDPRSHDFWSIYNYLTPETRGYFPMFIAANYVMNYYPQHGISPVIPTKPLVTDTIHVSEQIHFNQISAVLDIPVEELRVLNPQFRNDIIPGSPEKTYTLILPSQQVHAYLLSENEIKNYEAEKYRRHDSAEPGTALLAANTNKQEGGAENSASDAIVAADETAPVVAAVETKPETPVAKKTEVVAATTKIAETPVKEVAPVKQQVAAGETVTHKVKPDETLASIAKQYGVTTWQIRSWNNMTRAAVRTGQQLRIEAPTKGVELANSNKKEETKVAGAAVADNSKSSSKATEEAPKWKSKKERQREAREKAAPLKAQQPTSHTLKSGDNLSTLARKYGVTIDAIKKANNMKDDDLVAGDKITIPSKNAAKSSSKSSRKRRR